MLVACAPVWRQWLGAGLPSAAGSVELVQQAASLSDEDPQVSAATFTTSIAELRAKAFAAFAAPSKGSPKDRARRYYERSEAIRAYVLRRAEGCCEHCGETAPFKTKFQIPYLEPHHIRRLSDGGPDDPRFMAALCPNCHRRVHYSSDGSKVNTELGAKIANKEGILGKGR